VPLLERQNYDFVYYPNATIHSENILYNVWPLLDANCNLLGYRRHHSICYTCLFTTPPVVTTVCGYNVLWPSDVVSRSGPLISSVIFYVFSWMLTANWLTNSWLSKSTPLSRSSGLEREHLVQGFALSSTQRWLLREFQQFSLCCPS
jgi:hypothetical protein